MKNFLVSIVFLGVAAYVGLALYNSWSGGDWLDGSEGEVQTEEPIESLSYPGHLEIESSDGRKIQIKLIARNETHIQFERDTDSERFTYPISSLVSASRYEIQKYPVSGLIDAGNHISEPGIGLEGAHVEQLREAIRRINEKAAALNATFAATKSKTEKRTVYRKLEELKAERNELEAKIAERR